jgi:hypothetical protein
MTVDYSGGRRRCGDDGRRGEAAALGGVANGGGGWRGNWGRQPGAAAGELAWQTWEVVATVAGGGRWASGGQRQSPVGRARGGGGRTVGGRAASGGRRAGTVGAARMRVGGRGCGCSVQREREKKEECASRMLVNSSNSRRLEYGADES